MLRDQVEDLFRYEHLPEHLQEISKPFGELALKLFDDNAMQTPYTNSAIRDEMLRMLWDVKNRAVWLAVERNKNTGVA